ncbi:hypothetical protein ACP70R_035786 [Stipagrostis hirtigluma subsp. patula]
MGSRSMMPAKKQTSEYLDSKIQMAQEEAATAEKGLDDIEKTIVSFDARLERFEDDFKDKLYDISLKYKQLDSRIDDIYRGYKLK